jgi:hypothetical protein
MNDIERLQAAVDHANWVEQENDRLRAENERLQEEHREFVDGLTGALNAHGVPAMPSWREAIDYLALHGADSDRRDTA